MSKYVRGVKRNQIIQRWLQGIEDPEYEVFPTKKEGKYIVKLRESPLEETSSEPPVNVSGIASQVEVEEPPVSVAGIASQVEVTEPKPRPRAIERTTSSSDSTINLEILEQLRNLGEELRNDRFKKEQKQYIKHVVNKELNKSRIRSKYVPDLIPQENESPVSIAKPEPEPQLEPEPPKFRSRIRR